MTDVIAPIAAGVSLMSHHLKPPASAADWAAVDRMQRQSLRTRTGSAYPVEARHADPARQVLLLWYRGERVGTLRMDRLDDSTVAFRRVCVDASKRGAGHGAVLIQLAEALASADGADVVLLHAVAGSEGFYQKLGFHPVVWSEPSEHPTSVNLGKRLSPVAAVSQCLEYRRIHG
ncbi:MAG: N-acetyltransferase [Alphaproteobacteria bacterium]|nr:GNAT family N-acetyltransferase [Alphaproteobacteria bacterium]TAD88343.1 MAG: N-acetyltransferase [Alphaproteobacteria bacterium]